MVKIELQADEQTLLRALKLVESRQCSLEELTKEIIEKLGMPEFANDPFMRMFADEPGLMDKVIASAMVARKTHILRQSDG